MCDSLWQGWCSNNGPIRRHQSPPYYVAINDTRCSVSTTLSLVITGWACFRDITTLSLVTGWACFRDITTLSSVTGWACFRDISTALCPACLFCAESISLLPQCLGYRGDHSILSTLCPVWLFWVQWQLYYYPCIWAAGALSQINVNSVHSESSCPRFVIIYYSCVLSLEHYDNIVSSLESSLFLLSSLLQCLGYRDSITALCIR